MPQYAAVPDTVELTFLRSIPRHMVHRAAVSEVFLTDAAPFPGGVASEAGTPERILIAAQWPRDHALYHPDAAGVSDPLLFAETIRQAMVYVGHRFQDIPLSHRFIGFDIDFEIIDFQPLRVAAVPLEVVLDLRWHWEVNRPPKQYSFRVETDLLVGGLRCGRGSLRVAAVDDKRYGLLRRRGRPPQDAAPSPSPVASSVPSSVPWSSPRFAGVRRVPAAAVGRLRTKDSVLMSGPGEIFGEAAEARQARQAIGAKAREARKAKEGREAKEGKQEAGGESGNQGDRGRGGRWWLRLDPDHAILFDHPSDHAPLMGLLEGFRQLGHLLVHESVRHRGVPYDAAGRERAGGACEADGADDVSDAPPAVLVSLRTDCLAFGELDMPIDLVVREDVAGAAGAGACGGVRRLAIDAVQDGTVVASSVSEWLIRSAAERPPRVPAPSSAPSPAPSPG